VKMFFGCDNRNQFARIKQYACVEFIFVTIKTK